MRVATYSNRRSRSCRKRGVVKLSRKRNRSRVADDKAWSQRYSVLRMIGDRCCVCFSCIYIFCVVLLPVATQGVLP